MRREDAIQHVIDKNKFSWYLEVGTAQGDTIKRIRCAHRVGVDPIMSETYVSDKIRMYKETSDEFFARNYSTRRMCFDVVFIDGLHLYEQVIKDIVNALNCMITGGYIIIHDCKPGNAGMAGRQPTSPGSGWNGDVYKAIIWFKEVHPQYPCFVLDCDWGLGVIHKDKNRGVIDHWATVEKYNKYDYAWLSTHFKEYGVVPPEYLYKYVEEYNADRETKGG